MEGASASVVSAKYKLSATHINGIIAFWRTLLILFKEPSFLPTINFLIHLFQLKIDVCWTKLSPQHVHQRGFLQVLSPHDIERVSHEITKW